MVSICAMNSVAELAAYLAEHQLSPEKVAKRVKISNMTIRRLLQKPGSTALTERYRFLLNLELAGQAQTRNEPLKAEQLSGLLPFINELQRTGRRQGSLLKLRREIKRKFSEDGFSGIFCRDLISDLSAVASSRTLPRITCYLALGALAYFVNPFDFIPDAMIGVGYLDDFAVLSLVHDFILDSPGDLT
jgi:uncharacterized membrane protein YkvA (DUF1232 family)